MKSKSFFIHMLMVLTMLAASLSACVSAKEADGDSGVWICTGPKSKKYHAYEDCRGLNSCSGDLERVSIEEATEMGRDACKICRRRLSARAKMNTSADSVGSGYDARFVRPIRAVGHSALIAGCNFLTCETL